MARKKKSMMGYFKNVFSTNKQLLHGKSNAAVLAKYRADHGMAADADVSKAVKNAMANTKSLMRKKMGGEEGGPRKRTIKLVAAGGNARPSVSLETLEELLDDSLLIARNYGLEKQDAIVRHLHAARNGVVLMMGE